jgi:hypothetical protein
MGQVTVEDKNYDRSKINKENWEKFRSMGWCEKKEFDRFVERFIGEDEDVEGIDTVSDIFGFRCPPFPELQKGWFYSINPIKTI